MVTTRALATVLLAVLATVLAGCATMAPLPTPLPDEHWPWVLTGQAEAEAEAGAGAGAATTATADRPAAADPRLLVIQAEGAGLRFVLMDPLGVPIARQQLRDGRWQADGLLPPNPAARDLFAALLFAIAARRPADELRARYPDADIRPLADGGHAFWRDGQRHWAIEPLDGDGPAARAWRIRFAQPLMGSRVWRWQQAPQQTPLQPPGGGTAP